MGVVLSIPTGGVGLMAIALAATAAVPVVAGAQLDFNHAAHAAPSAMVGHSAHQVYNAPVVNADSFSHGALHDSSFASPYLKS